MSAEDAVPEDAAYLRFRASGDPDALAELYDRTADRLLRASLHLAPGAAAAGDLVQATFVAVIERAPDFDPDRPVLPWLLGILGNQAKLARWRAARAPDPDRVRRSGEPAPSDAAEGSELREALDRAIDALPAAHRPVLVLRLMHGMEPAEIAYALGRPPGTIRSQLSRGLERVRSGLPAGFASGLAGLAGLAVACPVRGLVAVREAVLAHALQPAAVAAAAGAGAVATSGVGTLGGTLTIGGLLMQKAVVTAIGLVAALAIGYAAWPGTSSPLAASEPGIGQPKGAEPAPPDGPPWNHPVNLNRRPAQDPAPGPSAGKEKPAKSSPLPGVRGRRTSRRRSHRSGASCRPPASCDARPER